MIPLNKYEIVEGSTKIVQIKLMDVLFNNKVSTLVYFRNITSLVGCNKNFNSLTDYEDANLNIEEQINIFAKVLGQKLHIESTSDENI